MLLRDLSVRVVSFSSEPIRSVAGDRTDYFRDYDQMRANDPMRRQQIRTAMKRYRQRRKATR
ncbi:MAG: hypothetical protein IOD11_20495 [Rhodocyclaceae bacterium]|nr:hypothetical protein [Rhodocyclaceae bacterium]MCA3097469.1 hypothetical protein [Rhodocyclaceae bacterium]